MGKKYAYVAANTSNRLSNDPVFWVEEIGIAKTSIYTEANVGDYRKTAWDNLLEVANKGDEVWCRGSYVSGDKLGLLLMLVALNGKGVSLYFIENDVYTNTLAVQQLVPNYIAGRKNSALIPLEQRINGARLYVFTSEAVPSYGSDTNVKVSEVNGLTTQIRGTDANGWYYEVHIKGVVRERIEGDMKPGDTNGKAVHTVRNEEGKVTAQYSYLLEGNNVHDEHWFAIVDDATLSLDIDFAKGSVKQSRSDGKLISSVLDVDNINNYSLNVVRNDKWEISHSARVIGDWIGNFNSPEGVKINHEIDENGGYTGSLKKPKGRLHVAWNEDGDVIITGDNNGDVTVTTVKLDGTITTDGDGCISPPVTQIDVDKISVRVVGKKFSDGELPDPLTGITVGSFKYVSDNTVIRDKTPNSQDPTQSVDGTDLDTFEPEGVTDSDRILDMRNSGFSRIQIANKLGMRVQHVQRILNNLSREYLDL